MEHRQRDNEAYGQMIDSYSMCWSIRHILQVSTAFPATCATHCRLTARGKVK